MLGGLFNQKNELRALLQGMNALNMLYVSYHYFTTPEALCSESGFSFVSSLINFYALGENRDLFTELFAQYVSAANIGSICSNVAQDTSHFQAIVNIYQGLLLNPANIAVSLFNPSYLTNEEEKMIASKNH